MTAREDQADDANWYAQLRSVSSLVAERFSESSTIEVLDGGCGSACHLDLPSGAHITGIDISAEQLERNALAHERIIGDLQTYEYPRERFDVIVCWDVLEHLDDPAAALDRFAFALHAGGLLILGFPDRGSVKGWLTRVLPFRTHVWVYRHVLGSPLAGTNGHGPFPTPMRPTMGRAAVIEQMRKHGLELVKDISYESPMVIEIRRRYGLVGRRWTAACAALRAATAGQLAVDTSDCLLVFSKPVSKG